MAREEKSLKRALIQAIHGCKKVERFKRDRLTEDQRQQLNETLNTLLHFRRSWNPAYSQDTTFLNILRQAEDQLKLLGHPFYPGSFWSNNAEALFVASIIALSVRTFFLQPFRIPTCSMFPSFSGMLTQLHADTDPKPLFFTKPLRWLWSGAENHHYVAPANGTVQIPLFSQDEILRYHSYVRYEVEKGREIGSFWLKHFFPKAYKVYWLWVNDHRIRIRVPYEFSDMEALLRKKFFPKEENFSDVLLHHEELLRLDERKGICLDTQYSVKKGHPFLHFDILLGDMVFVNRFSYHFTRPQIGDAIIFRTQYIPMLEADTYYIKRLVGKPGDQVCIKGHRLYRNHQLITGSLAFDNNNQRRGLYPGYCAKATMGEGQSITVKPHELFAIGDNSPFSYDSRYWGGVPEKSVIGKAFFVLHPFSWRWGTAEHNKAHKTADFNTYVFQ